MKKVFELTIEIPTNNMIKFLFTICILLSPQLLLGEKAAAKKATHQWVEIPYLKMHISRPVGWVVTGINRGGSEGKKSKPTDFIVTAAKFDKTTIDTVPSLTVRVLTKSGKIKDVDPEFRLKKLIESVTQKPGVQVQMKSEKEHANGIRFFIIRTLHNKKGRSLTSQYRIVANPNTGTIYTYTLTSPTKLWDDFFKKYGGAMVATIRIDDEF